MFIPFVTTPVPGKTISGVFFTGDRPSWVLAMDKSGVQLYPSGHSVVHAFTPCSLWESKGDFLLYSEEVFHNTLNMSLEMNCLALGTELGGMDA